MKTLRMQIHLNDEVPRIGSGVRIVEVEVGRKWTRLSIPGKAARIPRAKWNLIAGTAVELPPRKRRRARKKA